MKAYELLFFVAPTISDEDRVAVMKRIETTIAEGAGKVGGAERDRRGGRRVGQAQTCL